MKLGNETRQDRASAQTLTQSQSETGTNFMVILLVTV